MRWLFREAGDSSGVVVLEMTIPTGYGMAAEALRELVVKGKVPHLRWAEFVERKIMFFFEKVRCCGVRMGFLGGVVFVCFMWRG